MVAPSPSSAGNVDLANLLESARGFKLRYDRGIRSFQQSSNVWQVISAKFLDYLESELDLDRTKLDRAEKSFYAAWQESPQYHELESSLQALILQSKLCLARTFHRPPSMKPVYGAVRLTTKASRLSTLLEVSIQDVDSWLRSGRGLPVGRLRTSHPKNGRKRSSAEKTIVGAVMGFLPKSWWEWFAIIGAFVAIVVSLPTLLGLSRFWAVIVGLSICGILVLVDAGTRSATARKRTALTDKAAKNERA